MKSGLPEKLYLIVQTQFPGAKPVPTFAGTALAAAGEPRRWAWFCESCEAVAVAGAGLVTALLWRSAWPDLIVGLGIAAMNADAAREVWEAAREEHKAVA